METTLDPITARANAPAYDYDQQQWVRGPRALVLRTQQDEANQAYRNWRAGLTTHEEFKAIVDRAQAIMRSTPEGREDRKAY